MADRHITHRELGFLLAGAAVAVVLSGTVIAITEKSFRYSEPKIGYYTLNAADGRSDAPRRGGGAVNLSAFLAEMRRCARRYDWRVSGFNQITVTAERENVPRYSFWVDANDAPSPARIIAELRERDPEGFPE